MDTPTSAGASASDSARGGDEFDGLDALTHRLYRLSVDSEWSDFRGIALQAIAQWAGGIGAVWLTRSTGDPGVYTRWPSDLAMDRAAVAKLALPGDAPAPTLYTPIPAAIAVHGAASAQGLHYSHPGGQLGSVLLIYFERPRALLTLLPRALRHLVDAASLSLHQYIQRDEWLLSLGRTNRGSAAMVDAAGTLYSASQRFRELVAQESHVDPGFARLPFSIPKPALEGDEAFFHGPLHFRISAMGHLYQLHARRPLPLDSLSPREQQIARALGNGKTFKSVARQYDIAVSTVANHASRIYRKLGIFRREDLVALVRKPPADEATTNPMKTA